MHARRITALAWVLLSAAAACNAILGNEPRTIYPGDAAGGDAPSGVGVDGTADGPSQGVSDSPSGEAAAVSDAPPEGPAPSDGACTDASSDPLNCGRCGHSCLGAPCVDGMCQPTVLVHGIDPPVAMVGDDTTLWWVGGSTIYSCPKTGCSGKAIAQTATLFGAALWLTQGTYDLFFTDMAASPDGGTVGAIETWGKYSNAAPVLVANGGTQPRSVIFCGSAICWLDTPAGAAVPTLYSCSTTSCTPTTVTSDPGADSIVSDGQVVFIATSVGTIDTCGVAGCTSPTTIVSASAPQYMVTTGGKLVWSDNEDSVRACTLPSCESTTTTLAKNVTWPHALATDGSSIYFTTYTSGGSLLRTSLVSGSAPDVVAQNLAMPDTVVVDATRVYFSTAGQVGVPNSAQILWVAK
jgi:hypothetical protein